MDAGNSNCRSLPQVVCWRRVRDVGSLSWLQLTHTRNIILQYKLSALNLASRGSTEKRVAILIL